MSDKKLSPETQAAWIEQVMLQPVSENIILEKALRFQEANELDLTLQIAELEQSAPFDIYKIYCSKTGKHIGWRTKDEIRLLLNIHGIEEAKQRILYLFQTAVSANWLDTTKLYQAKDNDPIGYFVFCLSHLLRHKQPGFINSRDKGMWRDVGSQIEWKLQKIKLYEFMCNVPIAKIIEYNFYLHKICHVFDARLYDTPWKTLAEFCTAEALDKLVPQLKKIVLAFLEKRKAFTQADLVNQTIKNAGPRMFKQGPRGKIHDDTASVLYELKLLGVHKELEKTYVGSKAKTDINLPANAKFKKVATVVTQASVQNAQAKPGSFLAMVQAAKKKD